MQLDPVGWIVFLTCLAIIIVRFAFGYWRPIHYLVVGVPAFVIGIFYARDAGASVGIAMIESVGFAAVVAMSLSWWRDKRTLAPKQTVRVRHAEGLLSWGVLGSVMMFVGAGVAQLASSGSVAWWSGQVAAWTGIVLVVVCLIWLYVATRRAKKDATPSTEDELRPDQS